VIGIPLLSRDALGEDDAAVERQLHRWRFHPAMASDALRWASSLRQQQGTNEPTRTRTRTRTAVSDITHVHRPRVGAVGIALRNESTSPLDEAG
jgi:hypothetical protein